MSLSEFLTPDLMQRSDPPKDGGYPLLVFTNGVGYEIVYWRTHEKCFMKGQTTEPFKSAIHAWIQLI